MTIRTILAVVDTRDAAPAGADMRRWMAQAPGFPGSRVNTWRAEAGSVALAQRPWCAAKDDEGQGVRVAERWALVADVRLDERDDLASKLGLSIKDAASLSDRAMIVSAHQRWGRRAPEYLRGAFAYVLYDHSTRTLQAVRDPMGEKPLHIYRSAGLIVLSSVIAPILAHPRIDERLDERGVACLLCAPPGERTWTLFRGVSQVAPGETWLVEDGKVERRDFGAWPPLEQLHYRRTEHYVEDFRSLLADSMRDRLRHSRRVALSLSGGLDSTSVAATLAHLSLPSPNTDLQAISYIFDDLSSCDERRYIRPVIERYGIAWHPILADGMWSLRPDPPLPAHPHHVEIDPVSHLTDAVRRMAFSVGCDTLVTGSFGDALFDGGRFWLADLLAAGRWSHAFSVARRPGVRLAASSVWTYGLRPLVPRPMLRTLRGLLRRPLLQLHPGLSPELADLLGQEPIDLATYGAPPPVPARRAARTRDLLLRASTGYDAAQRHVLEPLGLEAVDPFFDRRLVTFALRVPADVLAKPPWTKRVLRLAMADRLPETVRLRPGKTNLLPLVQRGLLDRQASRAKELASARESIAAGLLRQQWLDQRAALDPHWFARGWREWRVLALEDWLQRR
jgi:asparagine synthase (glutamine-hydrolysing)